MQAGASVFNSNDAQLSGARADNPASFRVSIWDAMLTHRVNRAAGSVASEVTATPEDRMALTADLTMRRGTAGMPSEVLRPADGNGFSLAVKGC